MKEVRTGRYAYSKDGREYYGDEPDLSAAIGAAGEMFPAYRLRDLYIGVRVRLELRAEDLERLRPALWLAGALESEYGEGAGAWLEEAAAGELAELDRELAAAAIKWMRRHGPRPGIYAVREGMKIGALQHEG